jgi:hypothetical protein
MNGEEKEREKESKGVGMREMRVRECKRRGRRK